MLTPHFTEKPSGTMVALATADMARMRSSSAICGLAEKWHINELLGWIYRLYYYSYRNDQIQKPIHLRSSPESHKVQAANDLPHSQYAAKVNPVAILLERTLESKQPQQRFSLSQQEISYMEHFVASSDNPTEAQRRALLACLVEKPAISSKLITDEGQSPVPRDADTVLQDFDPTDLTGEISATPGSPNASQVDKAIVSTQTGLTTIHADGPVESDCRTLHGPPAATITPLADGPRTFEETSASCVIDIAFEEDTRLYGMHPANLEGEQALKLDKMMPKGYRYARDLQSDLVFIPPLNHPQNVPGSDFVIQKKGTRAVAIIRPPAAMNDTARRNNAVQHGLTRTANGYQPPEQNTLASDASVRQYNSANADQSVHHLSDQPQMSPTSRVITAINAKPPSQPLESADHDSVPSMYGVNYTQNHYDWQQTWHNTDVPGAGGMDSSYFSPHQYFGLPQYFGMPFDQTVTWDDVRYNSAYAFFQDTWYGGHGTDGSGGTF